MPNGGSIPGEIALNARARSPYARPRDEPADSCSQQVREAENDQRHPNDWQIVQPVVHVKGDLANRRKLDR